jgi:CheY-like chemotaxis protein
MPHYELIFMDCNMPVMDGFEATEAIRKLEFLDQDRLKIIALTANTNDSYKLKCN